MTDEIRTEEEKQCKCFCQSKGFRKFLVVAAGTFVGVYLALSLFTAIHKPPMPAPMQPPCPCQQMMPRPDFGHPHFNKGPRGDFHKKMIKHQMDNDRAVKVEIED